MVWRRPGRRRKMPHELPRTAEINTPFNKPVPNPRQEVNEQIDRAQVLAESRLIVVRLNEYLDLFDEWINEGALEGESDAEQ